MKRFLLPPLLFFTVLVFPQSKEDSLQLELSRTIHDTVRIKLLHQLYFQYSENAPQKAKETILKAVRLSEQISNDRLKVVGYNRYSDFLRTQSLDDSAVAMNRKALSLAEKINFKKGQSDALIGLSNSHGRRGSFEDARKYLEKNISIAKEMDDQSSIANSYMTLAAIHTQKIEYARAMELYIKASEIFKETGEHRNYARAVGNIGFVERSLGNYEKAEFYLKESDSIARAIDFVTGQAFAAYNLSIVYRNIGDLERAISFNNKAIDIYENLGNIKRVAFGKFTMGKIYWEKENFREALDYYLESLQISEKVNDSVNIGHSLEEVAKCYHRLENNEMAKTYLARAMIIAKGIGLQVLAMNVHRSLATIYEEERNYFEAHKNSKAYAILRDSIYTKEKVDLAEEIEAKYQNEQKTQEIALLESEKELQTLQLTKRINERNGIIAIALITLLLAALLYNQYRVKQRANKKLRELDELKSNFFANISHEFRTPLTLIKGPIEHLEQNPEEQLDIEEIKMIRRNSTRVLRLVNQLLDLSKIDQGSLKLEPTEGDIYKCLRAAAASFNSHAAQRGIDYRVQIPQRSLWASFDRDKLEKIIYNLLGNAFKFSENGGLISVEANHQNQELQLKVTDSGKGIPKDQLPFIFDRFYQVDNSATKEHEGSGIGLSLSKDLVELMDGTITVTSELHKGSFFSVHIPVLEIKTGPQIDQEEDKEKTNKTPFAFTQEDKRNVPAVLLVEDNKDMSHFIRKSIIKDFRVLTALDGEEGLKLAETTSPELIITDLMMPRMDGMELCKKLKTNIHTSHIPVVMLTAKAGIENKIEGLEMGADDYLTKPFNAKELLTRTKNLIEQRNKLRELYGDKEVQVDPQKVTVTSIDQKFLERLLSLLEKNYANSDFGVPQMQRELGMSKTQLHRKLKALTNEAPGELLRNFRLKRAAQLLSQKADSVTQIAYQVGFNNLSYFAKCFKELYGVAPSSY